VTVNPTESFDISAAEHKYPSRRNNNRREVDRPRHTYKTERGQRGDRGEREERGNRGNKEYREERADRGGRREPRRDYDRPPRNYNR
jgi:hypothetical protein